MNLSKAAKVTRVSNAVAAGTTDINSTSVHQKGYSGVEFSVLFGAITALAVTVVKLQGSHDNAAWADLAGTGQSVPDTASNKIFLLDSGYHQHAYVRCVVDRGTANAVVDGIIARQYLADREPVTHDASVGGSEFTHAPAEGTA